MRKDERLYIRRFMKSTIIFVSYSLILPIFRGPANSTGDDASHIPALESHSGRGSASRGLLVETQALDDAQRELAKKPRKRGD
jgi:hypothetical protein